MCFLSITLIPEPVKTLSQFSHKRSVDASKSYNEAFSSEQLLMLAWSRILGNIESFPKILHSSAFHALSTVHTSQEFRHNWCSNKLFGTCAPEKKTFTQVYQRIVKPTDKSTPVVSDRLKTSSRCLSGQES